MKEEFGKKIGFERIELNNEVYFKISNVDTMRPFFMSIVSYSNHWMFISSNGGLSAGRKDADHAIFPYYTDDKITESSEITGSKSIFRVTKKDKVSIWEPFSYRYEGIHQVTRNLYKNVYGNKLIFEEINHDLALTFRYQWNSSDKFGFVKKSQLTNNADEKVAVILLDGIQNILPFGVKSNIQNQSSNLVDAYKRSEINKSTGLGIYALSAIIVDKAEPSEALKANIAWSSGLNPKAYLASSLQLNKFRKSGIVINEEDIKAEKGAYFINAQFTLPQGKSKDWLIVADVNKSHSEIAKISDQLKNDQGLTNKISKDIDQGTDLLVDLVASSDGLQETSDHLKDTRHFSNTLFNIMRGGIFDDNYKIEKKDLTDYLLKANKEVYKKYSHLLAALQDSFSISHLKSLVSEVENPHFKRLCLEYMPLKFSRRHGDPSRPWNRFSINTKSELDGSKILDYEGNWRDIFQNWEALALSYPNFIENMIHKFLNASTFEGYNPYRVTKGGIDWEIIEPDDPWSYIGYWGDHQIIYLLKLLELQEAHHPGKLSEYYDKEIFVYANVPYRIKSYSDILKNPKDTIEFDHKAHDVIMDRKSALGADGALLMDASASIVKVNFIEKILATVLAKVSNLIPEGGIWMNTQRPEWNDANNALVGNGVSMVTLYYLRRFLKFFDNLLTQASIENVEISDGLFHSFQSIHKTLTKNETVLSGSINNETRKLILDELGEAASDYRQHVYDHPFRIDKSNLPLKSIKDFVAVTLKFLDHSIKANRRSDNLYHAYNIMTIENKNEISISYLSEMLEGQVAVLSSGFLSAGEVVRVLDSMRGSALYRVDQNSYLLYPNKQLPKFEQKNTIPKKRIESSELLSKLVSEGNVSIIEQDIKGEYHFNGNFKNAEDLKDALYNLKDGAKAELVKKEEDVVLQIFEEVFNHKAFTGRSGTFYGYEGLGSIYWHMVSKLQLAVQECCLKAIEDKVDNGIIDQLVAHYYEISEGIGVHKPPELYGAFPTDPYSHTPAGKGAQQPGMTGQVKEDILSRFGELGVVIENGMIHFNPSILKAEEFIDATSKFEYVDVHSTTQKLQLEINSLCFTYCQVPVVYQLSESKSLTVTYDDPTTEEFESLHLNNELSHEVFSRSGKISKINVYFTESVLI